MIPYQIDDKTYFIDEDFYWKYIDLPMDQFIQIIISGSFVSVDLNDSFNAQIVNKIENDKDEFLED